MAIAGDTKVICIIDRDDNGSIVYLVLFIVAEGQESPMDSTQKARSINGEVLYFLESIRFVYA